ncbi:response regulator with CheY-like receiver domain and winged-helix DNA-binding domain [Schinkia azotoformans MEV2011]|uniref:Response regulator with CheY-like receiver domain and winged-helix DNA-binding domain n=1 Tax=Schinkia azotoformans MEV2011 TaxID=1348973 RepID=A0A072NLB0_SCHAZ|nr:response regulator transcription factor [Schinkia azotoformans]KEF37693.1 response regulator with CheY-like receiver domain and winged-helix DNA-binding domain [Schinkia azotoformans MEV2011]MEC1697923.1 response regulator transcription factor [Schinkia azotoformans]MEC1717142.1 response regulator transcription factor [Schinkia azotoformans]MEC1725151.1 response regulator transcription factor [Schinkia azotoformans]MEC1741956.1 response regulator transcription factor [Schinkia azotoformans]
MKILIIEDEKNMSRFIELELKHEGYSCQTAYDGRTGLELALNHDFDVILLDLMLPSLNGIEVCRRIRAVKMTPIIMLTARDNVLDRVSGLDSGADDYIAKPFAIEELLARIRAVGRRAVREARTPTILKFKGIEIDTDARAVKRGDQTIELTKREYDLLLILFQNINRVLTRDVLLEKVWGYESFAETNVVDVYIRYLRNKIDNKNEESIIQTVRGAGYMIRS